MTIKLRDYQNDAVRAATALVNTSILSDVIGGIVVLPTGSGKSLVAAQTMLNAVEANLRPLLLSHRKELLVQDEAAVHKILPWMKQRTSVYCAGLGRKETDGDIVFASIASLYRDPSVVGDFDVILIDECHLIPRDANTMYGKVLREHFPKAKRIGLSATPYRLDSGLLTEGNDALFDEVLIQIPARDLVDQGYLSPLVGVGADKGKIDVEGVHKRAGDFITGELEQAAMNDEVVTGAVKEIKRLSEGRKSHLVFCVTVDHAQMVAEEMDRQGISCLPVWGNMPKDERAEVIQMLREGEIDALTNVDVLTTGVDIPAIDCISLLRPTLSKSRHVQSLGRGMRLHDDKENCLVLDFSGNCKRHGDVDELVMDEFQDLHQERLDREKEARIKKYMDEERERQQRQLPHGMFADSVDPMLGKMEEAIVYGTKYDIWNARNRPGVQNLVVTYETDLGKIRKWVCVEYKGGARYYAERWFAVRGVLKEDVPKRASVAKGIAMRLEQPESLSVRKQDTGFYEVLIEHFTQTEEDDYSQID